MNIIKMRTDGRQGPDHGPLGLGLGFEFYSWFIGKPLECFKDILRLKYFKIILANVLEK